MWLSEFNVLNCRAIKEAELTFSPHINYIYGSNGSGKTSLLEGLSILSLGRSFRTAKIAEVISYHQDTLTCSTVVKSDLFESKRIGIEKSATSTLIRVNKQNIQSQSELSSILPISLIHPLSHELISGGSSKRRRFIDWIAFYQYPEFYMIWKQYQSLLKQRNAALKTPRLYYALEHLTYEMCLLQQPIYNYRLQALNKLKETLATSIPESLLKQSPEMTLTNGFPKKTSLETETLVSHYGSNLVHEKRRGRTLRGVHCSDIKINLSGMPAATSASRGQSKILSLLLHISQSLTIKKNGVIAIDDLSAEVDKKNYEAIMAFISGLERQVFITSTEKPILPSTNTSFMFHVKQGLIENKS